MRYMLLVYSGETDAVSPEELERVRSAHRKVMLDATRKGILRGAEPLAPTCTATTVRVQGRHMTISDGPFAETTEQLAGYYILECENLDEAIDWAARIPTGCQGTPGCIEIRPLPGVSAVPHDR
jgi:hypothetical protein